MDIYMIVAIASAVGVVIILGGLVCAALLNKHLDRQFNKDLQRLQEEEDETWGVGWPD